MECSDHLLNILFTSFFAV